jgi:hypothetical protein
MVSNVTVVVAHMPTSTPPPPPRAFLQAGYDEQDNCRWFET